MATVDLVYLAENTVVGSVDAVMNILLSSIKRGKLLHHLTYKQLI
jgi:hypothetical protein